MLIQIHYLNTHCESILKLSNWIYLEQFCFVGISIIKNVKQCTLD